MASTEMWLSNSDSTYSYKDYLEEKKKKEEEKNIQYELYEKKTNEGWEKKTNEGWEKKTNEGWEKKTDFYEKKTEFYEKKTELILETIRHLYKERLAPNSRWLKPHLEESTGYSWSRDHVRAACQKAVDTGEVYIEIPEGQSPLSRDYVAYLRSPPADFESFIDISSVEDKYDQFFWDGMAKNIGELWEKEPTQFGANLYRCAIGFRDTFDILYDKPLGEVFHICQLCMGQRKLLGFGFIAGNSGARGIVPYAVSTVSVKRENARMGKPSGVRDGETFVNSWELLRRVLMLLLDGDGVVKVTTLKAQVRNKFGMELSETALGHSRLFELLADERIAHRFTLVTGKNAELHLRKDTKRASRIDSSKQKRLQHQLKKFMRWTRTSKSASIIDGNHNLEDAFKAVDEMLKDEPPSASEDVSDWQEKMVESMAQLLQFLWPSGNGTELNSFVKRLVRIASEDDVSSSEEFEHAAPQTCQDNIDKLVKGWRKEASDGVSEKKESQSNGQQVGSSSVSKSKQLRTDVEVFTPVESALTPPASAAEHNWGATVESIQSATEAYSQSYNETLKWFLDATPQDTSLSDSSTTINPYSDTTLQSFSTSTPTSEYLQMKDVEVRWSVACGIAGAVEKLAAEVGFAGHCDIFGSLRNGFNTSNSDLDLVFMSSLSSESQVHILGQIADGMASNYFYQAKFQNVTKIFNASTPLIKFTDGDSGFEVDLLCNNGLVVRNSLLLQTYCECDNRVAQLGNLIKQWAKAKQIVGTPDGYLSSYAYSLLVIYYLQCCKPPVVPNLQTLAASKPPFPVKSGRKDQTVFWDTRFWEETDLIEPTENKQGVDSLLIGFFEFYSSFEWRNHAVCPRLGGQGDLIEKSLLDAAANDDKDRWCIEDPFELTHNLSANCSEVGQQHIKEEIRKCAMRIGLHLNPKEWLATQKFEDELGLYHLRCRVSKDVDPQDLLDEFKPFGLRKLYVGSKQAVLEFRSAAAQRSAQSQNEAPMSCGYRLQLFPSSQRAVTSLLAASDFKMYEGVAEEVAAPEPYDISQSLDPAWTSLQIALGMEEAKRPSAYPKDGMGRFKVVKLSLSDELQKSAASQAKVVKLSDELKVDSKAQKTSYKI